MQGPNIYIIMFIVLYVLTSLQPYRRQVYQLLIQRTTTYTYFRRQYKSCSSYGLLYFKDANQKKERRKLLTSNC